MIIFELLRGGDLHRRLSMAKTPTARYTSGTASTPGAWTKDT